MSNFNSSSIQGNLVDAPKVYPGENPVARFTIANNTGYGDNRHTNFVDCVAFGKQVSTIEQHFTKGKRQNDYNATIRSEFVEFVDMLYRSGNISSSLADRATL